MGVEIIFLLGQNFHLPLAPQCVRVNKFIILVKQLLATANA